jgi:hypothetical protein
MNEIRTEIIINAPKKKIWDILTDFSSYGDWNPFLIKVIGNVEPGSNIFFVAKMNFMFVPVLASITDCQMGSRFSWGGPGFEWGKQLFGAEHFFILEEITPDKCRFQNNEKMVGFIADTIWPLMEQSESAYIAMNEALKSRAESK